MEQAAQWMSRLGATETPDWNDPEFAVWLDQSTRHREAFAEVSALWFAAEQIAPGDDLKPPSLDHQWNPLATSNRRTSRWRIGAGFAVALTALMLLPNVLQRWTASQSEFLTQRGETANITLADGSTIQMAGLSAFSSLSDGRGIELHYGEVFLQVTHDPQDPFVVSAGDNEVTVLGTQFGVAWRDGEHRAGVVSGRVSVSSGTGPLIQLGPGELAVNGTQSRQPGQDFFAWRSGNLVFTETPLSQVIDQLAPFLSQRIIRVPGAKDPMVSAVVNLRVGDQMLETLAQSTGMQILTAGPVTLLY